MVKVLSIPSGRSNLEFIVELDGVDYRMRLLWNARVGRWYLWLYTMEGAPVVAGQKLVADIPLLSHRRGPDLPPGSLWCVDMTGRGIDPGLRDLGVRCLLMYVEEESVSG